MLRYLVAAALLCGSEPGAGSSPTAPLIPCEAVTHQPDCGDRCKPLPAGSRHLFVDDALIERFSGPLRTHQCTMGVQQTLGSLRVSLTQNVKFGGNECNPAFLQDLRSTGDALGVRCI